jgi:hypothetical protein
MKRIFALLLAALLSGPALAVDVNTQLCVLYQGSKVYCQQSQFFGMTEAQARALERSGFETLDYASRRQNPETCGARCPYSIEWSWNGQPAVLTEHHTFAGVNQILRKGVQWLDARVTAAETNRQRGKSRPWGD